MTEESIKLEKWETRRTRQRKETLVITAKDKGSQVPYAEMIKNLRKQIDTQDIRVKVIEVKKVRGDFALKTAERKDGAVEKLESEIQRVIGEESEIRRSQRTKTIVVRDIEETIEREAVEKILGQGSIVGIDTLEQKVEAEIGTPGTEEKSGESTEGEDQSRKENKARTKFKTAMLTLLENRGQELLQKKKITVGWSRCSIQEKIKLSRCYKCQQFGHSSNTGGTQP